MRKLIYLVGRNMRCYFKDKMLFFVSLLTPMILLVLFITFLRGVYVDNFYGIFKIFGFEAEKRTVDGLAGAWLLSSVLSVCSVTVAICSNAVSVADKTEGTLSDLLVSPIKPITLMLSYFIANYLVTFAVMAAVAAVGFIYLAIVGWCLSFTSVLAIMGDLLIAVLFGSLLSSVVFSFINTQGGVSAVSTLVSAMYGFVCGAYMPLSTFSEGVRTALGFLPGTYGVGVFRKHFMGCYVDELVRAGLPEAGGKALMDSFDGNLYMFGNEVTLPVMYAVLVGACLVLLFAYAAIVALRSKSLRSTPREKK